ncbi:hypothetical protein L2K20_14070 [Mycobacterium sp. MBM]|nr:hypothetical protein [Mycobacterium sp. MBM]
MTDLDTHACSPHRLRASIRSVRRVLPRASCGLPAALLVDPMVAAWVRGHGVTVYAGDAHGLGLVGAAGVPPEQVVWQCGPSPIGISGALSCGVRRFVASAPGQLNTLADLAPGAASVHLDHGCVMDAGPAVAVGVIGIHCCVGTSVPTQWGSAAELLLARIAGLRRLGVDVTRISLVGGPADAWLRADKNELMALASAVDDAIDEGCARWRLPRPALTLGPSRP